MVGDYAWDGAVRTDRVHDWGTVRARVKKVKNAVCDPDCAGGVCGRHGDPLQFVQW